ncbi:hypothetical protein HPT27_09020 [Permianibacter sp. IMCC34836]|uniref:hypothetical protein n=1 Tax=Permianibacter fluminis TaxID=2738515 RepID=UPI001556389D|nr:hypothetical protein [Permianibacter fluminis]NQD37166.1 hypothetical protein [Permianibacter fluminis]
MSSRLSSFAQRRVPAGFRVVSRMGVCLLTAVLLLGSAHATPGEQAEKYSNISLHDDARPAISYALVRAEHGTVFSGHSDELKKARAYRRQHDGSYLWFRDGDQHYVVDDVASINKLAELWQATQPFEQQLQPLDDEMENYGRDMEDLSDEREDLRDDRYERRGDAGYHAQMAALDERADELSSKMESLGDRMEALGAQIEQLSRTADEQTVTLIHEALANGLAKPISP